MRLTLYRDHPAEGWPSMDRYAERLMAALSLKLPPTWQLKMPMPPSPWPGSYGRLLSRSIYYPFWAYHYQGDINHIVDHSYGHLLLKLNPARTFVTVHDVAPQHFPGRRGGLSGLSWQLGWWGLQRAQHVMVDSVFIGNELQTYLHLPSERIHVVPLAVSEEFCPQPEAKVETLRRHFLATGDHMLLHVGHTQPRKNLPTLLQALALLRQQGIPVTLIQVGGYPNTLHHKLIGELGLEKAIHFVGQVSNKDLITFYSAADIFVFPSLYEGFGLPILEAMACGTPVVASNAASLPEVAGEAGLLVDPNAPECLAETVARLLTDQELSRTLRQRGLERVRHFTWEHTAEKVWVVYKSLMEKI